MSHLFHSQVSLSKLYFHIWFTIFPSKKNFLGQSPTVPGRWKSFSINTYRIVGLFGLSNIRYGISGIWKIWSLGNDGKVPNRMRGSKIDLGAINKKKHFKNIVPNTFHM